MAQGTGALAIGAARGRVIVGLIYLTGAISFAVVGLVTPLGVRITGEMGAPLTAIGLTLALFSLPAAIAATLSGGIIDRFGPKLILILATLLMVAADALLALAPSLLLFDIGMVIAGIGFVGIVIGAPAMLVGALDGPLRTRAMAFWATYAPTGFSLGLLLAVPFTGTLDWRIGIMLHGALMLALAGAIAFVCPAVACVPGVAGETIGMRFARLFAVLRDRDAVRLAVAIAMPNMISYGTSLVAVTYIAKVHGVSLGASATAVAIAKIVAMLLGGTIMGALLARDVAPRRLFLIVVIAGVMAQILLFLPASPLPLAIAGLMAWLFAYGGATGVCMAIMPTLSSEHVRGGALAGVLNQMISIGSFLTPAIYFALPGWLGFVGLAALAGIVSLIALPHPRRAVIAPV